MALGLRRCDGILFEYRGVVYKEIELRLVEQRFAAISALVVFMELLVSYRRIEDHRNARALVAIVDADPVCFYQHLDKLLQTQENCKIRFKPLRPRN